MLTLNLKKEAKGYYSNTFNSIEITLSNPFSMLNNGSNKWQITIINITTDEEYYNQWFDTKKEAMQQGVKYLTTNLI